MATLPQPTGLTPREGTLRAVRTLMADIDRRLSAGVTGATATALRATHDDLRRQERSLVAQLRRWA